MNDYGSLQEIESVLEESSGMLGDIESILGSLGAIFSFASMGVSAIVSLLVVIFTAVVFVLFFVLRAIPVYSLAKKTGSKFAWLAWVPVFSSYCRLFVLCDIAGNKPFDFWNGKLKIKNRKMSFLAHLCISVLGGTIISAIVGVANLFLPIVGSLSTILALVPTVACAIIDYVYLRDIIDIFKENKESNNTTAIIITVIDTLLVGDFIRTIYLYTLLKRQPLPEPEIIVEEAVAE